jgi:hypothetical protein
VLVEFPVIPQFVELKAGLPRVVDVLTVKQLPTVIAVPEPAPQSLDPVWENKSEVHTNVLMNRATRNFKVRFFDICVFFDEVIVGDCGFETDFLSLTLQNYIKFRFVDNFLLFVEAIGFFV